MITILIVGGVLLYPTVGGYVGRRLQDRYGKINQYGKVDPDLYITSGILWPVSLPVWFLARLAWWGWQKAEQPKCILPEAKAKKRKELSR